MPSGVPVATVAIGGAANAAILAAQILALSDKTLEIILRDYKENIKARAIEADEEVRTKGK
jgi:5-(carboxyamino)imidazole ribonucleotide mutase